MPEVGQPVLDIRNELRDDRLVPFAAIRCLHVDKANDLFELLCLHGRHLAAQFTFVKNVPRLKRVVSFTLEIL